MAFRSDVEALVLATLDTGGAMHGYELTKRLNAYGEVLQPREAQLYPVLHRLENDGFIEAQWIPQEGKPSRKVYALTERGRHELEAKRTQWERFSASVTQLLGAGKGTVTG